MSHTEGQIRELADRLIASCDGGSPDDLAMIEDMTQIECILLDGMAFKCGTCDQWHDINDADEDASAEAGEPVCEGCA